MNRAFAMIMARLVAATAPFTATPACGLAGASVDLDADVGSSSDEVADDEGEAPCLASSDVPCTPLSDVEILNGLDDDCDGATDEDLYAVTLARGISPGEAVFSGAVWRGSAYAVFWGYRNPLFPSGGRAYVSPMDPDGSMPAPWVIVEDLWDLSGSIGDVDLLAIGDEVMVVATENLLSPESTIDNLLLARLDLTSGVVRFAARVLDMAMGRHLSYPSLAWTGTEFGAWIGSYPDSGRMSLRFARIGPEGELIEGPTEILSDDLEIYGDIPRAVWNGAEYSVAWHGTVLRADADGGLLSRGPLPGVSPMRDPSEATPSVAWSGCEWAVAWAGCCDARPCEVQNIVFGTLDADGRIIQRTCVADAGRYPSLVWTGSEYGVAWLDYRNSFSGPPCIYMQRLQRDGTFVGGEILVSAYPCIENAPLLLWADGGYSIFDVPHGVIYFRRVAGSP